MTLTMLGIQPVLLHTYAKENFLPSPERCAELITPKTKAIILVSPNNPVRPPLDFTYRLLTECHRQGRSIHHLFSRRSQSWLSPTISRSSSMKLTATSSPPAPLTISSPGLVPQTDSLRAGSGARHSSTSSRFRSRTASPVIGSGSYAARPHSRPRYARRWTPSRYALRVHHRSLSHR